MVSPEGAGQLAPGTGEGERTGTASRVATNEVAARSSGEESADSASGMSRLDMGSGAGAPKSQGGHEPRLLPVGDGGGPPEAADR